MLYSDKVEGDSSAQDPFQGRSRAGSFNPYSPNEIKGSSYGSSINLTQTNRTLFDVRFELNSSLKDYTLPTNKDGQQDPIIGRPQSRTSKFKKHIERILQDLETESCQSYSEDFEDSNTKFKDRSFIESDERSSLGDDGADMIEETDPVLMNESQRI